MLSAGVCLNGLLRWWCVRSNATFSAAFFIDSFDARDVWQDLALKLDLFLLLFLLEGGSDRSRCVRRATHSFYWSSGWTLVQSDTCLPSPWCSIRADILKEWTSHLTK